MSRMRESLRGTGKVFSFTFAQFWKNKANLVSLVILLVFSLLSVPVSTLAAGGSFSRDHAYGGEIALWNESGLSLDLAASLADYPDLAGASVQEVSGPTEGVCVHVSAGEDGLPSADVQISPDSGWDSENNYALHDAVSQAIYRAQERQAGLEEAQIAALSKDVSLSVRALGAEIETAEDSGGLDATYWIQLIYAIVVMMVSIFSVSYIVRAVVEEKASKLVELLMVSVKPLALILGKILAAMLYVFVTVLLVLAGVLASFFLSRLFLNTGSLLDRFAAFGVSPDTMHLNLGTVAVAIVSLLLGYLTFAILAGLSGSGCSNAEEIQGATSGSTMLIMLGYIASLFVSVIGSPVVTKIACLCPILSIFCAPVQYAAGRISTALLLLSWLIQLIFIVLLALFASRVYSALLIHRGSRVKFRQMLSMARGDKRKEAV